MGYVKPVDVLVAALLWLYTISLAQVQFFHDLGRLTGHRYIYAFGQLSLNPCAVRRTRLRSVTHRCSCKSPASATSKAIIITENIRRNIDGLLCNQILTDRCTCPFVTESQRTASTYVWICHCTSLSSKKAVKTVFEVNVLARLSNNYHKYRVHLSDISNPQPLIAHLA